MPRHKPDPALPSLARILRGLRVQRGLEEGRAEWIAAKVAQRAGTAPGVVSACELGSSRPSRDMLERLLDALRADPATREEALRLHAASAEASAAAVEARKAGHPKIAACGRFRAGESVGSIAASLGCSEKTVKAWIWGAGLSLRTGGAPTFDQTAFHVARIKAGYQYVSQIARAVGITPDYCGLVARGMVPSPETRAKIAAALGVPESALWIPTSPHG